MLARYTPGPTFSGSDRLPAVFGAIVFVYGGRPFLVGAYPRAPPPTAGRDAADRCGLEALAALLPDPAELVDSAGTRLVPVRDVRLGDVALVRPGGRVPADGVIVSGTSGFDESMITGESRSPARTEGDRERPATT